MFRSGIWAHATYSILRPSPHTADLTDAAKLDIQVILEPTDRSINQGLRFIALVYLCIGIYVLFRRWTAPKSTHFYVFCLVSFVLYSFKYTTELDTFDWIIYWGNIAAAALQPALFLHFAVSFSDDYSPRRSGRLRRRILCVALYLPGIFLIGLQVVGDSSTGRRPRSCVIDSIRSPSATGALLRHRRDRLSVSLPSCRNPAWSVSSSSGLPAARCSRSHPSRCCYVIPYLADIQVPSLLTKFAGLSLVFLPLTFSWAIVRYRLMDVDLIFKRGVTYTLATAALVGLYFGVVAVTAEMVHARLPSLRTWGLLVAIIVTGLIFDPLKRAIQARVDRVFDQKRFDYRETLVEFGRGLNSQTDLRALLDSIVERLPQTLLVTRVAVFLAADSEHDHVSAQRFELAASHGLNESVSPRNCNVSMSTSSTSTGRAPTIISSSKIRSRSCACPRRSA